MADLCALLPWDSEYWGFPVAKINNDKLTEDAAREAIRWCEEMGVGCLYFAADGTAGETLKLAWDIDFRFIDVRVEMEKVFSGPFPDYAGGGSCRLAVQEDLPAMEQLARTAHRDTRFFKDTNFDQTKAADLYALWVKRDFREQKAFVAVLPGDPKRAVGYLSTTLDSGHIGRIGLVAVSPEARGRGLGRLLVEQAMAWFRSCGVESVRVVTQGTNLSALRLYENCGFKVVDTKIWFHRWFNG